MGRNRFEAIWASVESRERLWRWLFLAALGLLALSLATNLRAVTREREVVRIGCDGIPQLVRLDERVYAEPDEREIRAFSVQLATWLMRQDSYSVRQDFKDAAKRMMPSLQTQFVVEARGTPKKPGAIALIESLQQRTDVPEDSLEITVDKKPYPWRAQVKGERRVVGSDDPQQFQIEFWLVRASRNRFLEGLLVERFNTPADSLVAPLIERPREGE